MVEEGTDAAFGAFLVDFFALFTQRSFRGNDYLGYLDRPDARRSGDEASIVDTAVIGPLLGLLGFAPAERVYNQQREDSRPDFAPRDEGYGTCFIVEDKNTAHPLSFDHADPGSDLSQLAGYVRRSGVRLGWLTNGRQFTLWTFDDPAAPRRVIDLDLPAAVRAWTASAPPVLPAQVETALHDLFDQCGKGAFTDPRRLERDIAAPLEVWRHQALPVGGDEHRENETLLAESVQALVGDLQRDARRMLDASLARYDAYADRVERLSDDAPERARARIGALRGDALSALSSIAVSLGVGQGEQDRVATALLTAEQDPRAYHGPDGLYAAILDVVNAARARKYADQPRLARPWSAVDELPPNLRAAVQSYAATTFGWHQRAAMLRLEYKDAYDARDDYATWAALVQETMLGGLTEDQRRAEFALQAAYVVFIRLLLLRVCEDKGVFPNQNRFVSDGGIIYWQETIERYLPFANGNPYDRLLSMAYENAQNIYAHFFTGRDLFNWYTLDREHLIRALHRLNRFDFAGVDSDIVGTIYSTYLGRKQRREKGQYYTPRPIVEYILDGVGYTGGRAIIGPNKRLIDPACGSGSLLVTAAKRLVTAYREVGHGNLDPITVLERAQDALYGFDLNPFACYLTEVNLLIQMLDLVKMALDTGRQPRLRRFHVYNVDALARPRGMRFYQVAYDTALAAERDEADRIKRREPGTPHANGFAFVVANPPYGATLSDSYKATLRAEWPDIFFGSPDTYTFFLGLGVSLLGPAGKLGFITPNTYLMGANTRALRGMLLDAGRIEEIVDLPSGIWPEANVDCVLLFLAADADAERRVAHEVRVHLMAPDDELGRLTARAWRETLTQPQSQWLRDPQHRIAIRHDTLLERIEEACRVRSTGRGAGTILTLDDVTLSAHGIKPYEGVREGPADPYIRSRREVPPGEPAWKPLLDATAFVGHYELRWGERQPYIKYGPWLARPREEKFFARPKLLVQDMRNRRLKRRLVATFDGDGFYNRNNLNNIIVRDGIRTDLTGADPTGGVGYDLKYVLALFNSRLLNYWFARRSDNLHITPAYFRQIPIHPADEATQRQFVGVVDDLLAAHAALNLWRARGYTIRARPDGSTLIDIPYDALQAEVQATRPDLGAFSLYDAWTTGQISIPDGADRAATVSANVFVPARYPTSLVLRHNKLWLDVPDDGVRRYLQGYLRAPRWRGKTWDDIKTEAVVWEDERGYAAFFAAEADRRRETLGLAERAAELDALIDEMVLDLYGITDEIARARIMESAPREDEEEEGGGGDVGESARDLAGGTDGGNTNEAVARQRAGERARRSPVSNPT